MNRQQKEILFYISNASLPLFMLGKSIIDEYAPEHTESFIRTGFTLVTMLFVASRYVFPPTEMIQEDINTIMHHTTNNRDRHRSSTDYEPSNRASRRGMNLWSD